MPTKEQRLQVEFLAAIGVREDQIVTLVTHPSTVEGKVGDPIDAKTLRKHFRAELDGGHTKADAMVARALYKNATTETPAYPGGIPVAQIFWLKTRARWKPPEKEAPPVADPVNPQEADERDTARRMAYLLAAGAHAEEQGKPKKAKTPA